MLDNNFVKQVYSSLSVGSKIGKDQKEVIFSFLRDGRWMRCSPVWHALGFINLVLGKFDDGELRLHVWIPMKEGGKTQKWKIHDHVYDFYSQILIGELNDVRINFDMNADGSHELYRVFYRDNESELRKTGSKIMNLKETETKYLEDDIYFCGKGSFHYSVNTKEIFTISLMAVNSVGKLEHARVIGEEIGCESIIRPVVNIDDEFIGIAEYLNSHLSE